MKSLLFICLFICSVNSIAATYMDKGDNKTVFVDNSGHKLTPLEANHEAENGKTILACKPQDYVCNERTGKCAMKNAK